MRELSVPTRRTKSAITQPDKAYRDAQNGKFGMSVFQLSALKFVFKHLRSPQRARWLLVNAYEVLKTSGFKGVLRALKKVSGSEKRLKDAQARYQHWIDTVDYKSERDREELQQRLHVIEQPPLISVLIPVYNTDIDLLDQCIGSIIGQVYDNWELCLADDCSPNSNVAVCLKKWEELDDRIKVVFRKENGHISAATNSAADIATGQWLALVDHDDVLPENALAEIALAIHENPNADFLYSDEDKLDAQGERSGHHFKPDWNEQFFLSVNYINHLSVYRAELFRKAGGLRVGYEGSQDHDLGLRIVALTEPEKIIHIPKVLYHWRAFSGSGSFSDKQLKRAVKARKDAAQSFLDSKGVKATVSSGYFGTNKVAYRLPDEPPLVSIIVPTKDGLKYLQPCLESVLKLTDYPDYEILVVDNASELEETKSYLADLTAKEAQVRVLDYPGEFNFSAINNFAVTQANGSMLCFLNNDTKVIEPGWLTDMVSRALQEKVGAVGAKLLFEDGTVQHAGVVVGITGIAGHAFSRFSSNDHGYNTRLNVVQNVTAVTAACMVVEKAKFEEVEGFDDVNLTVAFNDVDLCLKLVDAGYKNIYTPYSMLYHLESVTRGYEVDPKKVARFKREIAYMKFRWDLDNYHDPYFPRHLSKDDVDFSLR